MPHLRCGPGGGEVAGGGDVAGLGLADGEHLLNGLARDPELTGDVGL